MCSKTSARTIKIGGCEALKGLYDARSIGVTRIVAPMIESAYALKKYLGCAKLSFPKDERQDVSFLINIETQTGYNNFDEMLRLPEIAALDGIVLGRVDMVGSLGMNRDDINHDRIFEMAKVLAIKCGSSQEFVGSKVRMCKVRTPFRH
jgi:citrate lyase beta subunit